MVTIMCQFVPRLLSTMDVISIFPYTEHDRSAVIKGSIDLQETERAVSDLCLPGSEVAERYLEQLLKLNAENSGVIFVAKVEERVIGFIAGRIEHDDSVTTIDEANTYGYISDAWTDPEYRKRGVFKKLNEVMMNYFRQFENISIIKLNVLAKNFPAIAAYEGTGYTAQELILIKRFR